MCDTHLGTRKEEGGRANLSGHVGGKWRNPMGTITTFNCEIILKVITNKLNWGYETTVGIESRTVNSL